jgi:colanic acid/amylovoran biosynthesis glycosyltransferase
MACRVPVVSTRHNGFIETVEEGVTGFLVAERDTDAMAGRILHLLDHPAQAEQMGAAGRERVLARFQAEHQIERLRAVLLQEGRLE